MINCPVCGNRVSDESHFCPECGTRLDSLAEKEYVPAFGEPEADESEFDEYDYDETMDDPEEPVRRYRRKTYEEEEAEYYREGRKTVIVGVVLAALICVVGIGLYFVVSNMLNKEPKIDVGNGLGDKPMQVTVAPEKSEEDETEKEHSVPLEDQQEEEDEQQEAIQAQVTTAGEEVLYGLQQAQVIASQTSSVLEDGGVYHVSDHMVDGRLETSWQEGSDGDGTGDWVYVQFDQSYDVKYITFKLGNWKTESLFYANNRPQRLLLTLGDQQFDLSFPDGMREYTVELSRACEASDITIQVLGVYNGSSWSDCCITEMSVWGE